MKICVKKYENGEALIHLYKEEKYCVFCLSKKNKKWKSKK